jgi:hypothetical protein
MFVKENTISAARAYFKERLQTQFSESELKSMWKQLICKRFDWNDSEFFEFKLFKKGTIHLKFKDRKIWDEFNKFMDLANELEKELTEHVSTHSSDFSIRTSDDFITTKK